MAGILRHAMAIRNAQAQAYLDAIDGGGGPGTLRVYAGAMPESADAKPTGVLLAEITLPVPSGTVEDGTIHFTAPEETTALATGPIAFARYCNAQGAGVIDADAGGQGSGCVIEADNASVVKGGKFSMTTFALTIGEAGGKA